MPHFPCFPLFSIGVNGKKGEYEWPSIKSPGSFSDQNAIWGHIISICWPFGPTFCLYTFYLPCPIMAGGPFQETCPIGTNVKKYGPVLKPVNWSEQISPHGSSSLYWRSTRLFRSHRGDWNAQAFGSCGKPEKPKKTMKSCGNRKIRKRAMESCGSIFFLRKVGNRPPIPSPH